LTFLIFGKKYTGKKIKTDLWMLDTNKIRIRNLNNFRFLTSSKLNTAAAVAMVCRCPVIEKNE
jgi:hypothetical protein